MIQGRWSLGFSKLKNPLRKNQRPSSQHQKDRRPDDLCHQPGMFLGRHANFRTFCRYGEIASVIRLAAQEEGVSWNLDCCEFLDVNHPSLVSQGFNVVAREFMDYRPEEQYDVILMNPPFSLEGSPRAYIDHVMHAWSMLRKGGRFAAIVPGGWKYAQDKRASEFREFVCDQLCFEELGRGEFRESGAMVRAFLIYGEKLPILWRTKPYLG